MCGILMACRRLLLGTVVGEVMWVKFLSDNCGNPSAMRLGLFVVVLIPLLTWGYVCVRTLTMVPFDTSISAMIVGVFGAKAYQSGTETQGKCGSES